MKKTIAILLILVIGMVGVFAAYEATTVKITTEEAVSKRHSCLIS